MDLLISTVVMLPRTSAGRRVAEVGRQSAAVGRWVRAYEGLSAEPVAPRGSSPTRRVRLEFIGGSTTSCVFNMRAQAVGRAAWSCGCRTSPSYLHVLGRTADRRRDHVFFDRALGTASRPAGRADPVLFQHLFCSSDLQRCTSHLCRRGFVARSSRRRAQVGVSLRLVVGARRRRGALVPRGAPSVHRGDRPAMRRSSASPRS